jgi:purine-nucleoside phosphorylase
MKKYGSTEQDICTYGLSVTPESIQENVVIAPWWEPDTLPGLGEAKRLSPPACAIGVWNIKSDDIEMTYIKTGIGAPMFLEGLLPLGVTKCKRIIFVGSVGSLDPGINIGDIVIPEFSVCGDGTSRYISSDDLTRDVFGEKVYPDARMFDSATTATARICDENKVKWHKGKNFSTDTIVGQFAHIDTILNMGCNVIEMETAVAFRAAELMKIPLVALFNVSDNTATNKSLVSGRTPEEMEYRWFTRRELFPKIILSIFANCIV